MTQYDPKANAYASPACARHSIDGEFGFNEAVKPTSVESLKKWRDAMRACLITARQALPSDGRRTAEGAIARQLDVAISDYLPTRSFAREAIMISVYLPYRGEPDLTSWMRVQHERGVRVALPCVENRDRPLVFRQWTPNAEVTPGALGIPRPATGDPLSPDIVILPLVGYDGDRHRLGNGGGYFDRTLAAMTPRPFAIGVGFSSAAIATIYPQAYDIAMDLIVVADALNTR